MDDTQDLGKALAPVDSTFDEVVVEGQPDPLTMAPAAIDPEIEVVEDLGTTPPAETSMFPDSEAVEIVDESPIAAPSPEEAPAKSPLSEYLTEQGIADSTEQVASEEEPFWGAFSEEPTSKSGEQLIAAVLNTARLFKCAEESPNSVRRALATCDRLEKMIIAGVTADAEDQKISLAELKLLDTLEESLHYTRAALNKPIVRTAGPETSGGYFVYDPFCVTIAKILINGQVSGGKKVQDLFAKLKKKFSIDDREKVMISQIMKEMGYPVRALIEGEDMIEQYYA